MKDPPLSADAALSVAHGETFAVTCGGSRPRLCRR